MNVIDQLQNLPSEFGIKAAGAQANLKSTDAFVVSEGVRTLDALAGRAALIGAGASSPPGLGPVIDRAKFKNAAEYLTAMADHGRDRMRTLRNFGRA
jgi:hypothetical protein